MGLFIDRRVHVDTAIVICIVIFIEMLHIS